ncbi:hypothetical protein MCERE19_04289 [Spirosomataceae bacterium]
MADLSLKNFKKHFADDVKLWAAQCTVRECDEEQKGTFVAFVDQGVDSFDVSLKINPKQEIVSCTCDCPKGDGMCQHKLALMMHIVGNQKVAPTKLVKNKITPLEKIFSQLSHDDLKTWLLKTFEKDKALQVEFVQEFTKEEEKLWTLPELEKKLKELQKVVFGAKKNVETADFKKAMGLWENFALSAIKPYSDRPTLLIYFELFKNVLTALKKQISPISTRTFTTYDNIFKKIYTQVAQSIATNLSAEDFKIAINLIIPHLSDGSYYNAPMLELSLRIFKEVDIEKQKQILDLIIPRYTKFHSNQKFGDAVFTKTIMQMVETTGEFENYLEEILPISYANSYNVDLIEKLINLKKYDRAIKICNIIIKGNYYPEYNVPYYILLKKLYNATNNSEAALEIKKELLPLTGNFEDFLEIYQSTPDTPERKAWKSLILSKHRSKNRGGEFPNSDEFCIKMAASDKNYARLIDYLKEYALVQFFVPFLDEMLAFNKLKTLKNLLQGFVFMSKMSQPEYVEKEKLQYPIVLDLLQKYFQEQELNQYFSQCAREFPIVQEGSLVHFLSKHLL